MALSDSSESRLAIRRGPSSPVTVNFQTEDAYQPFNANIEHARPESQESAAENTDVSDSSSRSPTVVISPTHEDRHRGRDGVQAPAQTQTQGPTFSVQVHETRTSGESDETSSKTASAESSIATSASSISYPCDAVDPLESPADDCSPDESIVEEPVQGFQYHHLSEQYPPRMSSMTTTNANNAAADPRSSSSPNLLSDAAAGSRLTPNGRRASLIRPQSTYSLVSEAGRGRSPGHRAPSVSMRRSPEVRPNSYAELLNVPYPQPAPAPLSFDNSDLRTIVGSNASLLSTQKTLEMYRQNVQRTNDASVIYSFAVFLISTAKDQGIDWDEKKPAGGARRGKEDGSGSPTSNNSLELVKEARSLLQKLASNGYPFAQYYLADGYASGLFSKGKQDYNQAFPFFVLAAKHGHAESAYRTALCYEFGEGCRKDPARAVQFLRSAASKGHPGAMTRLGQACLSGDLGEKRYREGVKWMKLATEAADTMYNRAPYELACMYETGYGDDIFKDESYAAELFTQAAELGQSEASYRMGDAYEHGKLNCPKDPALSIHFYTGAAERGHAVAMFGLCAWYMVGAPPLLGQDLEEAFEWAHRSAELGEYI